jgi:hypothetical protein
MRGGASLHLWFSRTGPTWSLSDGSYVADEVAKLVIFNVSVVAVGDTLFPASGPSQTYRYVEN